MAEIDATGAVVKSYGYKPNSTWTTDPVFMKTDGAYYFYHTDHLGTPQKITDINGNTVWMGKYESFGKATIENETIENNLRFPGQYYDAETEYYYNMNRFYNMRIGRYSKVDPIGIMGGNNLYLYAKSNPIMRYDISGLWSLADYELFDHYLNPPKADLLAPWGEYMDISHHCNDYLKDPVVEALTDWLKLEAQLCARSSDHFLINGKKELVITTIYSFGKGKNHFYAAECHLIGNECCKEFKCEITYTAFDEYADPTDYGIEFGVPFDFGLTCTEYYKFEICE